MIRAAELLRRAKRWNLEQAKRALAEERRGRGRKSVLSGLRDRVREIERRRPSKAAKKAKKAPAARRVLAPPAKRRKGRKPPVPKGRRPSPPKARKPSVPKKRRLAPPKSRKPPVSKKRRPVPPKAGKPSRQAERARELARRLRAAEALLSKSEAEAARLRSELEIERKELAAERRERARESKLLAEAERVRAEEAARRKAAEDLALAKKAQEDARRHVKAQFGARFDEFLRHALDTDQIGRPPDPDGYTRFETENRLGEKAVVPIGLRIVPEAVEAIVGMIYEGSSDLEREGFPLWTGVIDLAGLGEHFKAYGARALVSDDPAAINFRVGGVAPTGVQDSYQDVMLELREILLEIASRDDEVAYASFATVSGFSRTARGEELARRREGPPARFREGAG